MLTEVFFWLSEFLLSSVFEVAASRGFGPSSHVSQVTCDLATVSKTDRRSITVPNSDDNNPILEDDDITSFIGGSIFDFVTEY